MHIGIPSGLQGALTFTYQNYGAHNYERIRQLYRLTMILCVSLQLVLGVLCYVFSSQVMSLFTSDPEVMYYSKENMGPICVLGFVNATMNVPFNIIKGMGHSMFPMICSILCVCVLRVVWVYTIFPHFPTISRLYTAWPVTKGIASICAICYYHWLMHHYC